MENDDIFDSDDLFDNNDDQPISSGAKPPPTATELRPVAERVAQGAEAGTHADGGIVPFPAGVTPDTIRGLLQGEERRKVEGLVARGYRATVFGYTDADGRYIRMLFRMDHATERKLPLPLIYCGKGKHGQDVYWFNDLRGSKPLYGLHLLAQRPDADVLMVEGEKAAEAARSLFPDSVVVTWAGGANNARKVDVEPLAGRRVTAWPDNDPAGRQAARLVLACSIEAGAKAAAMVDVPDAFPAKWDLADPLPAGVQPADLAQMLATARAMTREDAVAILGNPVREAAKRRLLGHPPGYSRVAPAAAGEALHMLDPDLDGPMWRRLARCWYYAYADGGLATFDAWSQRGAKYRSGEPAQLWQAFASEESFAAAPLLWLLRQAGKAAEESDSGYTIDAEALVTAEIEALSESHAVVLRGGKTVVMRETYDPRFQRYSVDYLKKNDFTDQYVRAVTLPDEDGKPGKKMQLGKLWFGSAWRRQYDGVVFMPGEDAGPRKINLWRGFAVEPSDNPAGWSRLKEHLRQHVAQGDEAAYAYILDWLAAGVQRLTRPAGTALVLTGPKGAGKSILIEVYGYLFGAHKFVTSISEDIVGKFNAHLEYTLLLGVEEAFAPQNRAADGTLKDLITRHTLRLEDKFFSAWTGRNHLRMIMTSNNDHVVRADGSDRRYAVFEVANPHQALPDERRAYFGAMVEQMETGGYQAMLGELLARDLSAWNAEVIPETAALQRQKLLNLGNDPVRSWLHARLADGVAIVEDRGPVSAERRWSEAGTTEVTVREALNDFMDYARRNNMRASERNFTMQLPRYMPPGFKSRTARFQTVDGSSTHRVYDFPTLQDARAAFVKATGLASWSEAGGAD